MNQEQQKQYAELREIAKREERAEQAKIRRAAKKWVKEHYGISLENLDKIVNNYKRKAIEHRQEKLNSSGGVGGSPPTT